MCTRRWSTFTYVDMLHLLKVRVIPWEELAATLCPSEREGGYQRDSVVKLWIDCHLVLRSKPSLKNELTWTQDWMIKHFNKRSQTYTRLFLCMFSFYNSVFLAVSAWCQRKWADNMQTFSGGGFEIHKKKVYALKMVQKIDRSHDLLFLGMVLRHPSRPGCRLIPLVCFMTQLTSRRTSLSCSFFHHIIPNVETWDLSSLAVDDM